MTKDNGALLKIFLDEKVKQYNRPDFIKDDPVCIPHLFTQQTDIEIAGLFAAVFAWGNRTTIINKSKELMKLMDNAPHAFCLHHTDKDLQTIMRFKHRTFNTSDLLYFVAFLKYHYTHHTSLEEAFLKTPSGSPENNMVEQALIHFHNYFFSLEHVPSRTQKHIATPYKGSTCKRLNMYLRWMVRTDKQGVDFGIWKKIKPSELICPIDLHVARVAKRFNILTRKQVDWQAAVALTDYLRILDPNDPVKYDFALFGLGVIEKY
jgi:uncharacterized protein (TIGR02757 family)